MGTVERVPIGDFPLGPEEKAALQRVIESGRVTEGREVRAFEEEYAAYMGTRYCVATSSGTAALMVGLRALGVSRRFPVTLGARVLVPALTFIATANAVELAGFRIVFGDIDPNTMSLDPNALDRNQIGMANIVLPVHLMGYAADIEAIKEKCETHKPKPLILAEDASEAHGTTVGGKKVGTFGVWGAFSFFPAHTVQAGELGCIVTDSAEIDSIARQLRAHGRECRCRICTRSTTGCAPIQVGDPDPRFRAEYVGWNFKPMEWSAALARVQLSRIDENIQKRKSNWVHLQVHMQDLMPKGVIEVRHDYVGMVPMAYPIILKRPGYRDRVVTELERRGVEARPLFGCIPTQQPAYAGTEDAPRMRLEYKDRVPVAERYGANGFYVGCHQYLSNEQIDRMASIIRDVIAEVVT